MPNKVLFLVPYPLKESPSQRFRFEQYFQFLEARNIGYSVQSFLNSQNWQFFFKPGKPHKKLGILLSGFAKRLIALAKAPAYDFVFIHREAAPVGPPVIEWIIANILNKRIIYDFDDAIWLTDRQDEPYFLKAVKWRSKVASICRWSYKVSCGNHYLCDYASQFNRNVVYNPTIIDTDHHHNPSLYRGNKKKNSVVIGWTGSHSTLKYLEAVEVILQQLENDFPNVEFLVIADRAPALNLSRLTFVPWRGETEIEDLLRMDIGIMPLPDDLWAKGKCGFKALQYMALGIPAVVSPVGVNTTIVEHGVNGFHADTSEAWYQHLVVLINNKELRKEMGLINRQKVINHYSVRSNTAVFLSLFE